MAKPALGRGLSALLGGKPSTATTAVAPASAPAVVPPVPVPVAVTASAGTDPGVQDAGRQAGDSGVRLEQGVAKVLVGRVKPSSLQPRRDFPEESLRELADSIREQGILQPLVVRVQGDHFELIAGERRWRAAQLVGLQEVPVIVREADDTTALEWMMVENLQREGLNPMDEAQGYAELMGRFSLTQEAVATKVGRSRAAVANALRLLKLPETIQHRLRDGRVSTGHAKVILGLLKPEQQELVARKIAEETLSVRQTEEWVARLNATPASAGGAGAIRQPPGPVTVRDPHVAAIEDRLRQRFGTKVSLRYRQGRGQIDIRFFSDDELERVLEIVGVQLD